MCIFKSTATLTLQLLQVEKQEQISITDMWNLLFWRYNFYNLKIERSKDLWDNLPV